MTIKFLTGFERELTQDFDCVQCSEPITNPICHDCLSNEILKWMNFYPSVKKKMASGVKGYTKEVHNLELGGVNCSACKSKKAALCPYCFTEGIFNMLKKKSIDKMIIMDFLSTFNFDLKHEGYIQDAISEGLY